jgi:hypothetical protein
MTSRTRRRSALISLLVPLALASCGRKEQPPPQVQTQEASPTAAPTTTLPPPTTVPTPPPVWRVAHWGMTKKEVLAAFPGETQRLARAADFAQPQPGSSLLRGASDLAIPAYEADGATFRVLFGFESDALNRVHLSAVKPGPTTCADLEKSLTTRHSEPSQRGSTGTSLKGQEIIWKVPDQTITLACGGVASLGFQTVTLDYMAPAAATDTRP